MTTILATQLGPDHVGTRVKVGDIDWEWSGTVEEATQIAQALLDAARYREAQEATR